MLTFRRLQLLVRRSCNSEAEVCKAYNSHKTDESCY